MTKNGNSFDYNRIMSVKSPNLPQNSIMNKKGQTRLQYHIILYASQLAPFLSQHEPK